MAVSRQYRALVADDDASSRASLSALLGAEGFLTFALDGGRAVLEVLAHDPFWSVFVRGESPAPRPAASVERVDFLVLDYRMPDLDGLEVLRFLGRERRRHPLRATLPAILVTGEPSVELERSVYEAGAFGVATKPVQPLEFRALVWRLVERHLTGSGS